MQYRNKRTAAGVIGALAGGGAIAVTMATGAGGAVIAAGNGGGDTTGWGAMVRVVHTAEDSVGLITGRALARPPYNDGMIPGAPGEVQGGAGG